MAKHTFTGPVAPTKATPLPPAPLVVPAPAEPVPPDGFLNLFGGVDIPTKAKKGKAQAGGADKPSIRATINELEGLPDAMIIAAVRERFPDTKFAKDLVTAKRHLAWYRWDRNKRAVIDFGQAFASLKGIA